LDIAEGMTAIDKADGKGTIPVELFTFAAPRVGDANLNNLLAERVNKSTLIAYGGDPVVHLPPLGPNFPITFEHPISLDLVGIHIGLETPIIPQAGQQYRTADTLFYIDKDGIVSHSYPMAQVALNFRDHFPPDRYQEALLKVEKAQSMNLGRHPLKPLPPRRRERGKQQEGIIMAQRYYLYRQQFQPQTWT
jgi:hypothetical protein